MPVNTPWRTLLSRRKTGAAIDSLCLKIEHGMGIIVDQQHHFPSTRSPARLAPLMIASARCVGSPPLIDPNPAYRKGASSARKSRTSSELKATTIAIARPAKRFGKRRWGSVNPPILDGYSCDEYNRGLDPGQGNDLIHKKRPGTSALASHKDVRVAGVFPEPCG